MNVYNPTKKMPGYTRRNLRASFTALPPAGQQRFFAVCAFALFLHGGLAGPGRLPGWQECGLLPRVGILARGAFAWLQITLLANSGRQ